jgi:hypothetical protein
MRRDAAGAGVEWLRALSVGGEDMKLAPQTSGVTRPARSKLGRGSIAPIGLVGLSIYHAALTRERAGRTALDCQLLCEEDFKNCDFSCKQNYPNDDAGYFDCRHGCTIGFDMCLAICELWDGPF